MGIRTTAAIGIAQASYKAMRALGRTGRALPGKLAMLADRQIVRHLSQGHKTIVITGTNGKTTTTHMVQQAIINTFGGAAYDPSSTNLEQGIATTLCLDSALSGKRKSDWAVIESDEGATKLLLPATLPQALVVTNLYRDQVDRYPTWTTARDYIIEAIRKSPETTLVLNADCQVCASIAQAVPNKVVWFGLECAPYDEGVADYDENVACINCGAPLGFARRSFAHLGEFTCPSCGYAHHRADIACVRISGKSEKSCQVALRISDAARRAHNAAAAETLEGGPAQQQPQQQPAREPAAHEITLPVNVRAGYDVYNAVAAFAGLYALGLPQGEICSALGRFKHAAHRFEIFDVNGTKVRLLLMKNTAGANQLLNMIASEDALPTNLVCLLGNEVMDGIYTDWIQGIHWEKLITPRTHIIVGGPCFEDMRRVLLGAGANESLLTTQTSYPAVVASLAALDEPATVIANCSTIENLRLELVKHYSPLDYWAQNE